MVCLESQQAQWARECCKDGNCPICNPPEEEECDYDGCQEDCDMDAYFDEKYG